MTTETLDAFHRGGFYLIQPKGRGHRAGMDAMMLAALVPSAFAGHLMDFGAGAGAAGLAVLQRCASASATLVERDAEMAEFARRSLQLPENAHLRERAAVLETDLGLRGKMRVAAGLTDHSADFVIMNPPFNENSDRATPDPLRKGAHVMEAGLFETWLRSARAVLRPSGEIGLIARPSSLGTILAAMESRFGAVRIVPVHPSRAETAIRILIRAKSGSKARLSLEPPLILRDGSERSVLSGLPVEERADQLANGYISLFGD
ncbi:tRNA1(Val) (adenine(37)-N6)-methyltransferase [Limoniibacter endophyticus]|uniref:Methyltransferase n=1 Tax=Limoniibacter endophyticus TaxID=1565040 RepID=A0A8J3DS43_9HYPH|nr:methyltransferase [Limoniibacter endophyticus]GHC71337.1 methyltransferase [Limoniibacter endophyticus]